MSADIAARLRAISDPESQAQVAELQRILEELAPHIASRACCEALLDLFERFPESDALGVFWDIVHYLEASADYEPQLLESLHRQPSEFGVVMLNRLINGGITTIGGTPLIELLVRLATDPQNPASVRKTACNALRYQRQHPTHGASDDPDPDRTRLDPGTD